MTTETWWFTERWSDPGPEGIWAGEHLISGELISAGNRLVANVYIPNAEFNVEEWEKHPRVSIIAAAPDLLAAAEALMGALDEIPSWYEIDITPETGDAIARGYDSLRAAIAKARP